MFLNTFCILIWIVVRYKIVILRLPTIKSVLSHSWRVIKVLSLLTSRRPLSLSQQSLCFSLGNILAPFVAPTPPGVLKDCSLLLHFIFLIVKKFMPMNGNALMVAGSLPSSFLFFVCLFFLFCFETGSLCSPGWPGTCYTDQTDYPHSFFWWPQALLTYIITCFLIFSLSHFKMSYVFFTPYISLWTVS